MSPVVRSRDAELRGVFSVKVLAQTGSDGLFDVRINLLALDGFVPGDSIDNPYQFGVRHNS